MTLRIVSFKKTATRGFLHIFTIVLFCLFVYLWLIPWPNGKRKGPESWYTYFLWSYVKTLKVYRVAHKIHSLIALWMKCGQNEGKYYRLIFISIELFSGVYFKISNEPFWELISKFIIPYCTFSWTINKTGSEMEKIVLGQFWLKWVVFRAHFEISYCK